MQTETLDKFNEVIERLYGIELALGHYIEALRVLGNDSLAERLEFVASDVSKCQRLVSEATRESVYDVVRQSGEATENMMLAALGVCDALATKDSEAKHPKPIEE